MNYNLKAIDMDAQVARNREIIKALPEKKEKTERFTFNLYNLFTEYFGDA